MRAHPSRTQPIDVRWQNDLDTDSTPNMPNRQSDVRNSLNQLQQDLEAFVKIIGCPRLRRD
ncbi:MAG: hypothetical protein QOJ15_7741 [Bradyrhizobium sp.]|nr:hypothetical protein [Bradyrhizobium sp.]